MSLALEVLYLTRMYLYNNIFYWLMHYIRTYRSCTHWNSLSVLGLVMPFDNLALSCKGVSHEVPPYQSPILICNG